MGPASTRWSTESLGSIGTIDRALARGETLGSVDSDDLRTYATWMRVMAEACPVETLRQFYGRREVRDFMR